MQSSRARTILLPLLLAVAAIVVVTAVVGFLLFRAEQLVRQKMAERLLDTVVISARFALDRGVIDLAPLEKELAATLGLEELRFVPARGVVRDPRTLPTEVETAVLIDGQPPVRMVRDQVLTLTRPLLAVPSCLRCHPGVAAGEPLAAVTLSISSEDSVVMPRGIMVTIGLSAGIGLFLAAAVCLWAVGRPKRLQSLRPILSAERSSIEIADLVPVTASFPKLVELIGEQSAAGGDTLEALEGLADLLRGTTRNRPPQADHEGGPDREQSPTDPWTQNPASTLALADGIARSLTSLHRLLGVTRQISLELGRINRAGKKSGTGDPTPEDGLGD